MNLGELEKKKRMANAVRFLSVDAINKANSGHPGMPLGMADVASILYADFLVFNPEDPLWPNRDRFVLSAGHGSALLYSLLHLTGYQDMSINELKNFRQIHSCTPGHPEANHLPGIEATTGPLGQGLANAVGMALAERLMSQRFGEDLINHYTYTIVGDGCLMEGISQEAISLAGHMNLQKLIVLFDDNGITIDGETTLSTSENIIQRFQACGWDTQSIDGHDYTAISKAIQKAKKENKPSFIACKTVIGFGATNKQGTNKVHGAPLGAEERAALSENLNWPHEPFEIPQDLYDSWLLSLERCKKTYSSWVDVLSKKTPEKQEEFSRFLEKKLPESIDKAAKHYIEETLKHHVERATRQDSQRCLNLLTKEIPQLIGGSADLTASNNTKASNQKDITATDFSGSYLNYGIREHAMGAIMNGLALYGGFIPYGGTFLVFSDYMRPAMRLSALTKLQVIYVLTHDSIGLGEDGPTHQPVEHLASLRAIPNMYVFRPCDAIETMESWQTSLTLKTAPSVLALTRQALPLSRTKKAKQNLTSLGGYIICDAKTPTPRVILLATGSEVPLALKVQDLLSTKKISSRVVSLPCLELFDKQSDDYKNKILGTETSALRVSIEAGIAIGWEKYIGQNGLSISLDTFGLSAPAKKVFDHFGFKAEDIAEKVKKKLDKKKNKKL